jgi:HPr kinase/phosphorylase
MARLVEVAALTQALKKMGHDPAKDFNDRLIAYMTKQGSNFGSKKFTPIDREEEEEPGT